MTFTLLFHNWMTCFDVFAHFGDGMGPRPAAVGSASQLLGNDQLQDGCSQYGKYMKIYTNHRHSYFDILDYIYYIGKSMNSMKKEPGGFFIEHQLC